jgi:hypothetical protein
LTRLLDYDLSAQRIFYLKKKNDSLKLIIKYLENEIPPPLAKDVEEIQKELKEAFLDINTKLEESSSHLEKLFFSINILITFVQAQIRNFIPEAESSRKTNLEALEESFKKLNILKSNLEENIRDIASQEASMEKIKIAELEIFNTLEKKRILLRELLKNSDAGILKKKTSIL